MASTVDRRSFVIGAGTSVASALALGAAATALAEEEKMEGKASQDIAWEEEFDVVVMGAGLAGLAAAVTVGVEGGGATCLLLEKGGSPKGMGNSPFSGGGALYTTNVPLLFEYLKELRGDVSTPSDEILEVFANGCGEIFQWMKDLGMNEDELEIGNPNGDQPGEFGELESSKAASSFEYVPEKAKDFLHVCDFMLSVIERYPDTVEERVNCPVTGLVQDPSTKEILGVTYTDEDGIEHNVRAAKGVIMCCGGFENDPVMKETYFHTPLAHAVAGVCNTGDGHRMCMRIGANFWHMHSGAGFWTNGISLDGQTYNTYRTLNKDKGITVAVNGRRFYMDYDAKSSGWPKPDSWETLEGDVGCRHGHQQYGGEWPLLPTPSTSWFVFDADGAANGAYLGGTGDIVADGFGYQADTIEELGELMGVPVEEFVETVDLWNQYCENGKDLSFHRPTSTLNPVATPPFYAMKQCCELLNTDGGPERSAKAEILDLDGNPIPHLYSAGEFGSIWSHWYQGNGNLGECLVFGRIAVHSALGL